MNITSSHVFQYLGCAIVVIVALYIVMSLFNYQVSIVEGLTNLSSNSENIAAKIKADTTQTLDSLLIDKYRNNYEDIILNMHEWCDAQILSTIVSGKIDLADKNWIKILQNIKNINDIESFKTSLNKTMKYLDEQ